jgi:hypothetical protein
MFTGKFRKKDGKLIFDTINDKLAYEIFLEKIPEGQKIDMFLDLADPDHTNAQLAKVHACIRELAKESGYTFDDMKSLIKIKAGLAGKSFADCSKTELMLAIESCIEIGRDNYNLNL